MFLVASDCGVVGCVASFFFFLIIGFSLFSFLDTYLGYDFNR